MVHPHRLRSRQRISPRTLPGPPHVFSIFERLKQRWQCDTSKNINDNLIRTSKNMNDNLIRRIDTLYIFACWRNAKKKPKPSPHHGWSPATQPPNNKKKKQSNVGNSQCHVYHINQPPVITIFVYRCYGYHSRSWLVYGIVLPTLFHLLLL